MSGNRHRSAVDGGVAPAGGTPIVPSTESGAASGMRMFDHDLARLLVEGAIAGSTAPAVTKKPAIVEDLVPLLRRGGAR